MSRCAACGGENPDQMRFCGHCAAPLQIAGSPSAPGAGSLRKLVSRQVAERLEAGGELEDEWRLVTTLFADISGYVALSERLDPESLADATNPIVGLMTDVAERYEAHVAKFAGDALLCMFGAPVVHEDDADRALLAGLEMKAELDRLRPDLPAAARDLELHIGVNTGRVVAALYGGFERLDYNVMGDAVNLAQRLESAAPGGEIYVGDATVRLTRDRFDFERIGEITVRGKSEPVLAWRLMRRRPSRTGAPMAPMVDRRTEAAALATAYATALDGRGAVVAVTGDAGTGKTRLCQDAMARLRPRGVRALQARFPSVGGIAYGPYADIVRQIAGIDPDDPPARAGRALAGALFALGLADAEPYLARIAGLPSPDPVPEPEAFRRGLWAAFASLVRALAAQAPLAVIIEDFHWADEASVGLTAECAALCADNPLVLLLTGRPEAAPVLESVLARAPVTSRRALGLDALEPVDIGRLVANTLGAQPPPGLADTVGERAAGNPFFVKEIVRALVDDGTLSRAKAGWSLRAGWDGAAVPPTIEGVLAARIDRLRPDAASVLQVASVAGRRVPMRLLRDVLGSPPGLDASVDALVAAGLVHLDDAGGEPTLRFDHALVADVAYERLLRRRRTELHRTVAERAMHLWGTDDDVVEFLATHLYLGGGGAEWFDVLVRAGERARRMFANDAALVHFERAAEVASPERRPEMLLAVADLAELRGDYERALAVYEEVREATGDVRAWRGIASTLRKRGEYAPALAMLEEALSAGAVADAAALRLEHGWTLSVAGRYPEAIVSLKAGLEAAAGRRDGVAASLLLELARAETVERDLATALAHAEEARANFSERGDMRGLTTAVRIVAAALHRLGRLDDAAATLREGLALAERVGSVEEIGGCLINLGMVELERGALGEAVACDRRAIEEFERIGHGSGRAIGYGNLAEKLLRAGSVDEAAAWCERALEHARSIGHTPTIADATRTHAQIALAQGRRDEAALAADEAARIYDEMGVEVDAADARRIAAEARG